MSTTNQRHLRRQNLFVERELGLVKANTFQAQIINRRIQNITLDPAVSIQREHVGAVNTIDIEEAEGRYLLSGGGDGNIYIYDLEESEQEDRRIIKSFASLNGNYNRHKGGISRVHWYPFDNGMFTTSSYDSTIKVWDTNAMEVITLTDSTVRLWDIRKSSACLCSLDFHNSNSPPLAETNVAHSRTVNGLSFTPDGLYLITTGHDDKMRLWNLHSGQNTLTNYGTMIRNQYVNTLTPLISPLFSGSSYSVFHPSDDRTILMFDLLSGALVKRMRGAYGRCTALAWRPRTEEIYSAGNDHDILVWGPEKTDRDEALRAIADTDTWSDSD
ncbi:DNA excision repair protein ERCC-8 [Podila verticillata]|nr:DNA excision repair protein ERCC-8 [Podila verticillata]